MSLRNLFRKKPKQIDPFSKCPFQGSQYGGNGICDGVECQLWSVHFPYHGAERIYGELGMCSLKLLAEAQAFGSRGQQLAEISNPKG